MSQPHVNRLLLVDDHLLVRAGLRSLLDGIPGFEVAWEAGLVREALESFTQSPPDLTLLDVRLPDGDGLDCLREMLSARPAAKIIMLSANAYATDVHRARNQGASGFLTKTVNQVALADALHAVMRGQKVFPSGIQPLGKAALTPREMEVLHCLRRGFYNGDAAAALQLSEHTVRTHVKAILAKLEAADRTEAVSRAFDLGYLRTEDA